MEPLSEAMAIEYRAATLVEIRSWSFGELRAVRQPLARVWPQKKGTLDDDGIFGPRRDYECACGRYRGKEYERLICDLCGVKVASHELRQTRFAHIELAYPIPHPLVAPLATLDAIPVLPAKFWESRAGSRLASSYEDTVTANGAKDPHRLIAAVERIFEVLLPVAVQAHDWGLQEADVIARGLALVPRREDEDHDVRSMS